MRFYEPVVAARKAKLFEGLHGRVLEIGPGTGVNIPHFPSGVEWVGVEPNPYMRPFQERAAAKAGLRAEFVVGSAESVSLADASVDFVVGTLVLCSVEDVSAVLREVRRVLKPGGEYRFIEHVSAPEGSWHARWQKTVKPVWKFLACGCHCDRTTWADLEAAGFDQVHYERFELPFPVVRPHIIGRATCGSGL